MNLQHIVLKSFTPIGSELGNDVKLPEPTQHFIDCADARKALILERMDRKKQEEKQDEMCGKV